MNPKYVLVGIIIGVVASIIVFSPYEPIPAKEEVSNVAPLTDEGCTSPLSYCYGKGCTIKECTNSSDIILAPGQNLTQFIPKNISTTSIAIHMNKSDILLCKLSSEDAGKYHWNEEFNPYDVYSSFNAISDPNCSSEFDNVGTDFMWKSINMTFNNTQLKVKRPCHEDEKEYDTCFSLVRNNISKLSWNRDTNTMVIE